MFILLFSCVLLYLFCSLVHVRQQTGITLFFSSLVNFLILLPRLGIPNLGITDMYQRVLRNYANDIELVSRTYTQGKKNPPISQYLPPVAGKILWARHLYRKIQEPMELFQQQPGVLDTAEAKDIIVRYNCVATMLMECEVLHHRSWMAEVRVSV